MKIHHEKKESISFIIKKRTKATKCLINQIFVMMMDAHFHFKKDFITSRTMYEFIKQSFM